MTPSQEIVQESTHTRKVVEKVWGHEEWVTNNDLYCGKFLYLTHGHQGSLHYHPVKAETFCCIKGTVKVELMPEGPEGKITKLVLSGVVRDSLQIPPGVPHRFAAVFGDAVLVEFSTPHSDDDVVRLEESK